MENQKTVTSVPVIGEETVISQLAFGENSLRDYSGGQKVDDAEEQAVQTCTTAAADTAGADLAPLAASLPGLSLLRRPASLSKNNQHDFAHEVGSNDAGSGHHVESGIGLREAVQQALVAPRPEDVDMSEPVLPQSAPVENRAPIESIANGPVDETMKEAVIIDTEMGKSFPHGERRDDSPASPMDSIYADSTKSDTPKETVSIDTTSEQRHPREQQHSDSAVSPVDSLYDDPDIANVPTEGDGENVIMADEPEISQLFG